MYLRILFFIVLRLFYLIFSLNFQKTFRKINLHVILDLQQNDQAPCMSDLICVQNVCKLSVL